MQLPKTSSKFWPPETCPGEGEDPFTFAGIVPGKENESCVFFADEKPEKKKGRKKLREHQMLMKCQLVVEWNSIGNTTYIKVEGCLGNAFKDVFGSLCLIYQPFVYTFSFKHHHETFTLKLLIASPLGNETFHCCLGLLF